jgi:hypothetical protein
MSGIIIVYLDEMRKFFVNIMIISWGAILVSMTGRTYQGLEGSTSTNTLSKNISLTNRMSFIKKRALTAMKFPIPSGIARLALFIFLYLLMCATNAKSSLTTPAETIWHIRYFDQRSQILNLNDVTVSSNTYEKIYRICAKINSAGDSGYEAKYYLKEDPLIFISNSRSVYLIPIMVESHQGQKFYAYGTYYPYLNLLKKPIYMVNDDSKLVNIKFYGWNHDKRCKIKPMVDLSLLPNNKKFRYENSIGKTSSVVFLDEFLPCEISENVIYKLRWVYSIPFSNSTIYEEDDDVIVKDEEDDNFIELGGIFSNFKFRMPNSVPGFQVLKQRSSILPNHGYVWLVPALLSLNSKKVLDGLVYYDRIKKAIIDAAIPVSKYGLIHLDDTEALREIGISVDKSFFAVQLMLAKNYSDLTSNFESNWLNRF